MQQPEFQVNSSSTPMGVEENEESLTSELYLWADLIEKSRGRASVIMVSGDVFRQAADTIIDLEEQVEALTTTVRNQQTGRALLALEKERELCDLLVDLLNHKPIDHDNVGWVTRKQEGLRQYAESRNSEQ